MKLTVTFLAISFVFGQIMFAQTSPTYQIRYYNTENGLPSNGVKGLEWDEETGFLWMATEAGIVRFNGIDFKTFSNQNTSFITSERISFMTKNNRGDIYVADVAHNVVKVNQNNLLFYRRTPPFDGLFDPNLYGLAVSDTFLTHKIAHPGTISFPTLETKLLSLSDTSMLVIDSGRVLYVSMTREAPLVLSFIRQPIKTLFKTDNKTFLVAENNEIFLANVESQTLTPIAVEDEDGFMSEVRMKDARLLWDNESNHPLLFNQSNAWELFYDGIKLIAKRICNVVPESALITRALYNEEKKIVFIGTASKGLIMISEKSVTPMKKKTESINEPNAYYSQVELSNGNILTSQGDVIGPQQKPNPPLPIHGIFRFDVYMTRDSLLWYIQKNSALKYFDLHCYNYKTHCTVEYPKIPLDMHVAIANSLGKTYIVTGDGFGELQQDTVRYRFKNHGLSPYNITEISQGVFIVACCETLLRFNTITSKEDTLLSLPSSCIRSLWKFNEYLFIGTYGNGYYVYKNGILKSMPRDKNNFLSHVHCFVPDKYGYCWMSTNKGLFKASIVDLVNAFENDGTKVYYHYFGQNDGMDMTEMNGGCTPCALQMKNGSLSFPTMDGLLWVNAQNALAVLPTGNIFIDEIRADEKKIKPDSLALQTLSPNIKELEVRLAFSAWSNKENLYVDFDLNHSGKWRPVIIGTDATVQLFGLEAGNYILRIRKKNGFGANNYSYKELRFSIGTPWYQQWWFYVLMALIAVAVGGLYVKWRTRQYAIRQRKLEQQVSEKTKELQQKNELLEKKDSIKSRLISIISHDIITPLKFLTVAGKNLAQKKQLMSEEMQNEAINEITNTSQDLQLLSTNILNWIKYEDENRRMVKENLNLHEKVDKVLGVLNSLAHQKQLYIENEVDKELVLYQYADAIRTLVYNLVLNAINFTEKGNITVTGQSTPNHVIIGVKDEGVGMTPDQIQNILSDEMVISSVKLDNRKGHGLGYVIIKDLIKMIGGELKIDSRRGEGTFVSVILPSRKDSKT
jgi:signal transduction histidine kinase